MTDDSSVPVFFYGGLINPEVMKSVGLEPTRQELATLPGFDIRISPYVNLVRNAGHLVFGMLMEVTHAQLQHAYSQLKAEYQPEPVLVLDADGAYRPALCYLVAEMPPDQADVDYVEALATAGEALGFPDWYLAKIRGYLPSG
jgi:Gamma-glutamyl cyclotransferase, AIG2-like